MPLREPRQYKSTPSQMMEIQQPGIGGLNLKDLEYEQQVNQSPYMLNMMYRNGSFSKRYGQEIYKEYENKIYSIVIFNDKKIVHSGTKIYIDDEELQGVSLPEKEGLFIKFYLKLYYLIDSKFYQYGREFDEQTSTWSYKWSEMEPYVPTLFNGAEPGKVVKTAEEGESGFAGYPQDAFNLLSNQGVEYYNADGTSKGFYIKGLTDYYDWSIRPTIKIDEVETTAFTLDETNKKITFTTAPVKGYDNVEITWTLKEDALKQDRDRLLKSKYAISYGNSNNTRLFMAGGGDSKYFFSDTYDPTYFPEPNWEIIGRTEDDITGFGLQYNTLFVFKPSEIYSIGSYTNAITDPVTKQTETSEYFLSQLVNAEKGCDAPNTIQLIDNKLTWFSSRYGILTMVSSNILDERNVRVISRNIEKTNNFGVKGILDFNEDLNSIQSADYDNKYFLVFPESGMCFMWDYQISPYYYTSSKEADTKLLDFFLFNNFHVKHFERKIRDEGSGEELIYVSSKEEDSNKLITLNESFSDYKGEAIESYYMTPFLQFGKVEYLKSVSDIYVQTRGDTATRIDMWYYTEETTVGNGIEEPEQIRIGGKIWEHFTWDNFQWFVVNWANTFRRRCSLKKIQMCAFFFKNNETNRDMSISHISLQYRIVKLIK